MTTAAIALAAAEAHTWAGVNPYWVGAITLVIFLAFIAILVSFGNGRDHS